MRHWNFLNVCILLMVVMLLFPIMVNSKTMWGARRRREVAEDDTNDVNELLQNLGSKQKKTPRREDYKVTNPRRRVANAMPEVPNVPSMSEMKATAFGYLSTIEAILDNDFQLTEVFNPEIIQGVIDSVFTPEVLQSVPDDLRGYLDSLDLKNPKVLKRSLKESLPLIREYLEMLFEYLENPAKLQELLTQFPEYTTILSSLTTGDMTPLKEMLLNIPGIDETNKQLMEDVFAGDFSNIPGLDPSMQETLSSLMSGDFASVLQQLQQTFATSDTFETLRQELVKTSSEMGSTLEELGLPSELLQNPKAFQREVQGKVNALLENVQTFLKSSDGAATTAANTVTTSKPKAKGTKGGKDKAAKVKDDGRRRYAA